MNGLRIVANKKYINWQSENDCYFIKFIRKSKQLFIIDFIAYKIACKKNIKRL